MPVLVSYFNIGTHAGNNLSIGPLSFVNIKPEHKSDEGVLVHELTHVKQHQRAMLTHAVHYYTSDKYRLECECEAFAYQYRECATEENYKLYIDAMLSNYDLGFCSKTVTLTFDEKLRELFRS